MSLDQNGLILLTLAFFVIATLYASVGFGGGSSYLALLALILTNFFAIRTTALLCNLIVVSGSCLLYYRSGHLQFKKFLPFIITSVPLAFVGAVFRLEQKVFFTILAIALIISSIALAWQTFSRKSNHGIKEYPTYSPYLLGAGIGFLSGLVGIGGGIFLAPVLNHLKWDRPVIIASLASFFILVNSISGITGLFVSNSFEIFWPETLALLIAVLLGGQLGVRISLGRLSANGIRILTAILVFFVGFRLLLKNGFAINFML